MVDCYNLLYLQITFMLVSCLFQAVQIERKALSNQVVDASAESRRLQAEIKAMHRSVKYDL